MSIIRTLEPNWYWFLTYFKNWVRHLEMLLSFLLLDCGIAIKLREQKRCRRHELAERSETRRMRYPMGLEQSGLCFTLEPILEREEERIAIFIIISSRSLRRDGRTENTHDIFYIDARSITLFPCILKKKESLCFFCFY